ncbi:hypothetical protein [Silvimonas soli]|uniref:hypothetical protein n=1 Tax=Silvimonas soli TaxID=2980100 RepID=UPI0024B3AC87|nr:hypothetical protein [Silvimonas soli]
MARYIRLELASKGKSVGTYLIWYNVPGHSKSFSFDIGDELSQEMIDALVFQAVVHNETSGELSFLNHQHLPESRFPGSEIIDSIMASLSVRRVAYEIDGITHRIDTKHLAYG